MNPLKWVTPSFFEPVLRRAIESAEWCSADPISVEKWELKTDRDRIPAT